MSNLLDLVRRRGVGTFAVDDAADDPQLRELRTLRDRQENDETRPPPGEAIDLQAISVAECYPPAHIGALLDALRRLGWATEGGDAALSPERWVERRRWSPGAKPA